MTGEIDTADSGTADSDTLLTRGLELLDADSAAIVLDLSGVVFFASSGISVLMRLREHGARHGDHLVHVVAGRSVRRSRTTGGVD